MDATVVASATAAGDDSTGEGGAMAHEGEATLVSVTTVGEVKGPMHDGKGKKNKRAILTSFSATTGW